MFQFTSLGELTQPTHTLGLRMSAVQEGRRSEQEALGVSCGSSLANEPMLTGGNEVSISGTLV